MKNLPILLCALGLLQVGSLGCGDVSEPDPISEPRVNLDLQVFQEDGAVKGYAFFTNTGKIPIYTFGGPRCGILMQIRDGDGNALELTCGGPDIMPCIALELQPGEVLQGYIEFRGDACGEGGMAEVPSGQYEVFAGIQYRSDEADGREAERHQEFTWP